MMKHLTMFASGILLVLLVTSQSARSAEASGYTMTDLCGLPPFRSGPDMHLHLTRFPKQKPGQELVLNIFSPLGPLGITDSVKAPGQLCSISDPSACSGVQEARVQVLKYSGRYYPLIRDWFTTPHIVGTFKVRRRDGTAIEGSFSAKARKVKYRHQPICE